MQGQSNDASNGCQYEQIERAWRLIGTGYRATNRVPQRSAGPPSLPAAYREKVPMSSKRHASRNNVPRLQLRRPWRLGRLGRLVSWLLTLAASRRRQRWLGRPLQMGLVVSVGTTTSPGWGGGLLPPSSTPSWSFCKSPPSQSAGRLHPAHYPPSLPA